MPLVRVLGAQPRAVAAIAAAWPDAEIVADAACDRAVAVLAFDVPPQELVRCVSVAPARLWLHTIWAGLPDGLVDVLAGLARDGLVVTNGAGAHGCAVAEHVLALLLAHYKRLPAVLAAQREHRWDPQQARELRGQTVGLVGLGDLGRSIARLLGEFGVAVIGVRRTEGAPIAGVSRTVPVRRLAEILPLLDALILAVPLTAGTRGLIGAAELALLPPSALLVNVARGPVVDEPALVDALRAGRLGGAALDVLDTEPLPADSPLWSLPGTIITPHCADLTAGTEARILELLLSNISRYRAGQPLRNVVDPARGY